MSLLAGSDSGKARKENTIAGGVRRKEDLRRMRDSDKTYTLSKHNV